MFEKISFMTQLSSARDYDNDVVISNFFLFYNSDPFRKANLQRFKKVCVCVCVCGLSKKYLSKFETILCTIVYLNEHFKVIKVNLYQKW
jgi:hypothetical protein